MMKSFGLRAPGLTIDLGTSNTRIYVPGRGVVASDPSLVAVRRDEPGEGQVVAVGAAASQMLGRLPRDVSIVHPIKSGVIADFESTETLLRALTRARRIRRGLLRPRVVMTVPLDLTGVERRAAREIALLVGGGDVQLVPNVMAAALGAGLPVTRPSGNLILDVGGGTTEVAVVSLSGIVCSSSRRVGGDGMNEALRAYVKRKYNLLIGDLSAELLKIQLGSAHPTDEMRSLDITGRDLIGGIPRTVSIGCEEAREALIEPVSEIVEAVRETLEHTPPELSADISERGIVMAGGGSLLANLDVLLREATGLPAVVAEDPLHAVVRGAGRVLEEPAEFGGLGA